MKPPILEQQEIVSIISSMSSQIQKQQIYNSILKKLKKGLMQKLLTGKIRVKF
jgi:type I restriction enzyme, S subunit